MNCPKCGNSIGPNRNICEYCGANVAAARKMIGLSNSYYNKGLEKAKVRDMGGAVECLKKSLEYNKRNTDARNLLGLVLYETGEVVAALGQWVISKNLNPEDNDADYFMEKVQENPTELDSIGQSLKKYNLGLAAAREGHYDTALIMLKKAVGLYANNLKALLLMSLLYMATSEYAKAGKTLLRAYRIDKTNTMTLKYMNELGINTGGDDRRQVPESFEEAVKEQIASGHGIGISSSYKEDKPNIMVFVNLILGVIIGIVVVYYLIVPTMKNNMKAEFESRQVDYSAELSSKSATIAQQEKKIASLEKKVDEISNAIEEVEPVIIEVPVDNDAYGPFFDIVEKYDRLKDHSYTDDELIDFSLELWSASEQGVENSYAKTMLDEMRNEIYTLAGRKVYKAGKALYDESRFEEAIAILKAAVDIYPNIDSVMYYLGKACQAVGQYDEAIEYYNMMLEKCPNSTLKEYIPTRIEECRELIYNSEPETEQPEEDASDEG